MAELQLTPALRFPTFNGNWSKSILQDLSKKSISYGIVQTGKHIENGIPCLRVVDLTRDEIIIDELITTSEKISNSYKKTILEKDELMIALRGVIGHTQIVTENLVGFNLTRGIARVAPKKKIISPQFLFKYLNSPKNQKAFDRRKNGSALKEIPIGELRKFPVKYPSLPEQQKIASFLTAFDQRIQLLQKKKTKLEEYKKGVMQKLFSQEIRFKDENGNDFPDWEEKKLGDIGEFKTSSVDKKIDENLPLVYLVNYMNVYRHETISNANREKLMQVSATETQLVSNDLKKGDILFTPSSETPSDIGHSVVIFEDLENTLYSYHLMRFRPTIDIDLMYSHYFCNIPSVLRQISSFATGSTRFTISVDSFSKIQVSIPSLPEQKKIARFLTSLDELIESLGKEIEETTTFKKGLLQKMFV